MFNLQISREFRFLQFVYTVRNIPNRICKTESNFEKKILKIVFVQFTFAELGFFMFCDLLLTKVNPWSQDWLIAAGAFPGFCSMKRLEVFLLPLDGMLVHRRSLPRNLLGFPQQFTGTHWYTWVERGTVRVKCHAQEHNTMWPARAWTWTARSEVERTNQEATAHTT